MRQMWLISGTVMVLGLTMGQWSLAQDPHAARAEVEEALGLVADSENGARIYQICSVCHRPEGWGSPDGVYPQIAGQHSGVVIKQLADIRARNRDNPIMYPFAVPGTLGGVHNYMKVIM